MAIFYALILSEIGIYPNSTNKQLLIILSKQ